MKSLDKSAGREENGGGGEAVAQLVEALRHKTAGPGFDSRRGAWKCLSDRILLARTADSSAVFVVPNVKVRMEAEHSIPTPRVRDL